MSIPDRSENPLRNFSHALIDFHAILHCIFDSHVDMANSKEVANFVNNIQGDPYLPQISNLLNSFEFTSFLTTFQKTTLKKSLTPAAAPAHVPAHVPVSFSGGSKRVRKDPYGRVYDEAVKNIKLHSGQDNSGTPSGIPSPSGLTVFGMIHGEKSVLDSLQQSKPSVDSETCSQINSDKCISTRPDTLKEAFNQLKSSLEKLDLDVDESNETSEEIPKYTASRTEKSEKEDVGENKVLNFSNERHKATKITSTSGVVKNDISAPKKSVPSKIIETSSSCGILKAKDISSDSTKSCITETSPVLELPKEKCQTAPEALLTSSSSILCAPPIQNPSVPTVTTITNPSTSKAKESCSTLPTNNFERALSTCESSQVSATSSVSPSIWTSLSDNQNAETSSTASIWTHLSCPKRQPKRSDRNNKNTETGSTVTTPKTAPSNETCVPTRSTSTVQTRTQTLYSTITLTSSSSPCQMDKHDRQNPSLGYALFTLDSNDLGFNDCQKICEAFDLYKLLYSAGFVYPVTAAKTGIRDCYLLCCRKGELSQLCPTYERERLKLLKENHHHHDKLFAPSGCFEINQANVWSTLIHDDGLLDSVVGIRDEIKRLESFYNDWGHRDYFAQELRKLESALYNHLLICNPNTSLGAFFT